MLLKPSTLQLLRFPFSFFLMPVYWFSLSCLPQINFIKATIIFCVIHLLVYPASNGYNSYMDRDTDSIGGIKNPMKPEKELFYVTIFMDILSILLALLISTVFTVSLICYIVCSRLYSYRGVRLKKYPIIGYLIVVLNQGGLLFFMVYQGSSSLPIISIPWLGIVAACFLIGGFYPITQIYQHTADSNDGVKTISILLGKKGTFIFCAFMYMVAFALLYIYYLDKEQLLSFAVLQLFFLPVLIYFINWAFTVWKNEALADFKHTMQMNWIASGCINLGFITLLILHHFG